MFSEDLSFESSSESEITIVISEHINLQHKGVVLSGTAAETNVVLGMHTTSVQTACMHMSSIVKFCARILVGGYTDYSIKRLKRICDKTESIIQPFPYFWDGSPCHL